MTAMAQITRGIAGAPMIASARVILMPDALPARIHDTAKIRELKRFVSALMTKLFKTHNAHYGCLAQVEQKSL